MAIPTPRETVLGVRSGRVSNGRERSEPHRPEDHPDGHRDPARRPERATDTISQGPWDGRDNAHGSSAGRSIQILGSAP